jgi:hypothetical protein
LRKSVGRETHSLAEGRLAKREADAVIQSLDRLLGLAVGLDRAFVLLGRGHSAVLVEVERRDDGERRIERELDGREQVLLGGAAKGEIVSRGDLGLPLGGDCARETDRLSDRAATVSWGNGLDG